MKYLKTFEGFNPEILEQFNKLQSCKITEGFCRGTVSQQDFYSYLDEQLNESWLQDIKNFVINKVGKVLITFIREAAKFGVKILTKAWNAIKWIWEKINAFADKNPKLWRIMLIVVVVLIICIFTAASAKAATTGGNPPDKAILDGAIGLIKNSQGFEDTNLRMKVVAYLVDLKDGIQNVPTETYGQKVIDISNFAIKSISELTEKGKETLDSNLIKELANYVKEGAKITKSSIENIGGQEIVTLGR